MMEYLWKNINDLVCNNEKEETSKLGWLIFHKWQEGFSAQRYNDSYLNQSASTNWSPPNIGWLKCNVDAGFNRCLGTTNHGWCLRDDHGILVTAGAAWDGGTLFIIKA